MPSLNAIKWGLGYFFGVSQEGADKGQTSFGLWSGKGKFKTVKEGKGKDQIEALLSQQPELLAFAKYVLEQNEDLAEKYANFHAALFKYLTDDADNNADESNESNENDNGDESNDSNHNGDQDESDAINNNDNGKNKENNGANANGNLERSMDNDNDAKSNNDDVIGDGNYNDNLDEMVDGNDNLNPNENENEEVSDNDNGDDNLDADTDDNIADLLKRDEPQSKRRKIGK